MKNERYIFLNFLTQYYAIKTQHFSKEVLKNTIFINTICIFNIIVPTAFKEFNVGNFYIAYAVV